jgi:hypothetical protein
MLTTKATVHFATITPALLYMLTTLERLSRTFAPQPQEGVVITSGSDSTHMVGSKHYIGEAVDVRSKTFGPQDKRAFADALRDALGPQFTVLLEHEGLPQEHWHVQVKKGRRFDPVALVNDAHALALATALRESGRNAHAMAVLQMRAVDRCVARFHRGESQPRAVVGL